MTIWHSIILGIVEGITEFLPISSTGHLILAGQLLHITDSDFVKSFDIIIQLGSILAVVVVYWKKLWNWMMIKKLVVAFIPTGIIGLALYKVLKAYLLGNNTVVLWALLLGGILLIAFEIWYKKKSATEAPVVNDVGSISYKQAATIGLFQAIAIIPGVSRSGATIIGGMLLGLSRATIVEFSFLLAVPTMIAASGLDLVKSHASFTGSEYGVLLLGFIVSFIVAWASIKWLLSFIRRHDFIPFGIYRIVAALVFFLLVLR
jgi:undecaprenyl-diphosphatase